MRAQAQLCARPPAPVLAPLAGLVWNDTGGEAAAISQQTGKLAQMDIYEEVLNVLTFGKWILDSQGSASSEIICLFLQVNSNGQMKITVQRHNMGRCIDWVENCSYVHSFLC